MYILGKKCDKRNFTLLSGFKVKTNYFNCKLVMAIISILICLWYKNHPEFN